MTTIGMVSREMLGADGTYSGDRAKEWGRTGPPHDLETKATPYKLGSAALVSTWDDLVAAISNGYPVTICTNQGFNLTRDSDGFCRRRAPGATAWSSGGCASIAQGHAFSRAGDPISPSGPMVLDQPSFSFWAEQKVVESILGEGDCWALSKAPAFVQRDLPPAWKYDSAA